MSISRKCAVRSLHRLVLLTALSAAALLGASGAQAAQLPTVIKQITVDDYPAFIAANPITNRIYTSNLGGTDGSSAAGLPDNISVIDGATDTELARLPVGDHPSGIDVNYTTNRIYVANTTEGTITVIDGNTNLTVETILLPAIGPPGTVLPPEGCPVNNAAAFGVQPRRWCPGGITVDQETGLVYVAAAFELPAFGNVLDKPGKLAVLNDATNSWTLVPTGISPTYTTVDSLHDRAYVNAFGNPDDRARDFVTAVNTNPCCNVITNIEVANQPYGIDVDPERSKLYVGHVENRALEIINTDTYKIIKTLVLGGVGDDPDSNCPQAFGQRNCATRNLTVGEGGRVYVNGLFDNVVWVVQGGTVLGEVLLNPNQQEGPRGIAFNPVTGKLYVGDTAHGTGIVQGTPDGIDDAVTILFDKHGLGD